MACIRVEVAFAVPGRQVLTSLEVPVGASAREAVLLSGLDTEFADLSLASAPLGVFGEHLPEPERYLLQEGDRVEIYRPLLRDPKKRRRDKAAGC